MSNYEPELGQAVFGQPHQTFQCPNYLEQALKSIRNVMEVNKTCGSDYTPFDNSGERFKNDVFEANAYDWSECRCEGSWDDDWTQDKCTCGWQPQLYNFKWKDVEVSWYKYLGRGMSVNRQVSEAETQTLLSECLKSLLK